MCMMVLYTSSSQPWCITQSDDSYAVCSSGIRGRAGLPVNRVQPKGYTFQYFPAVLPPGSCYKERKKCTVGQNHQSLSSLTRALTWACAGMFHQWCYCGTLKLEKEGPEVRKRLASKSSLQRCDMEAMSLRECKMMFARALCIGPTLPLYCFKLMLCNVQKLVSLITLML
ncbi:hypothetical protein HJG60_012128 [Phyllostomus discolor]|uniref:Uncharacterized protein n=1 Tax=Phyllostomus discolor TaxID=89673 RepID=A0A833ZQ84_9CHIR|nr:hypothetical protein HJG60_012128 [Phyllostomus discolor]